MAGKPIASVSLFACRSDAELVIDNPQRYLRRLCKHFSHKVRAEWSDARGQVGFAMGVCELLACDERLMVICAANNRGDLTDIVDTLDRHIHGFAKGKDYNLRWLTS